MWTHLEKELVDWLKSFSSDKLQFRNSYQATVGFPADGFRSDGMLTDGETLLAVEVEAGQMHPDTNVGKYWLLHSKYKAFSKIVLLHIYTPKFNSYGRRKELGDFYASKMAGEVPIEYIQLDYREATDYQDVLDTVKQKLSELIASNFVQA